MLKTAMRDPERLGEAIAARYDNLSKRLQQIARFALDHPNDMALETIAVIAGRAGVQPSTLIRFAKAFGYTGFTDMQRVFQVRLVQRAPSYSERIRSFREQQSEADQSSSMSVLREFAAANIVALEHLHEGITQGDLDQAIGLLVNADHIYIVGQRRSFPVAAYLTYVLSHVGCSAHLLDGIGGLLFEQAGVIGDRDVLVAVSYPAYAPETVAVTAASREGGIPVVAITDSPVSPVVVQAQVCLIVNDAEVHGFRSLSASLCLAQTLAMDVGLRLDQETNKKARFGRRAGTLSKRP